MRWHLVYRDCVHSKISVSKKFETRDEALREARALITLGCEKQTLVGPNEKEISRETIVAFGELDEEGGTNLANSAGRPRSAISIMPVEGRIYFTKAN